jgi:threonine dehydrogenase-like Zn-dependent dehydrogenase
MPAAQLPGEPGLRDGAAKIDVAWCGICGSDLHEYPEGPIFAAIVSVTAGLAWNRPRSLVD